MGTSAYCASSNALPLANGASRCMHPQAKDCLHLLTALLSVLLAPLISPIRSKGEARFACKLRSGTCHRMPFQATPSAMTSRHSFCPTSLGCTVYQTFRQNPWASGLQILKVTVNSAEMVLVVFNRTISSALTRFTTSSLSSLQPPKSGYKMNCGFV